jgi:large subunit ribosomal protein L21
VYAVIESGGKQYRVEKGSKLLVDRLSEEEGSKVTLRAVALLDGKLVTGKDLEKVKVEAKVTEHLRGPKLRVFKYRPKKGYRRTRGHRSELTRVEITEIKTLQRKPAAKAEAKGTEKAKPAARGTTRKPAGTRRKPSTRKTSTRQSTAKKKKTS